MGASSIRDWKEMDELKTLTYEYENIKNAVLLLDRVAFLDSSGKGNPGIEKARMIATIADILDSGIPGETFEKEVSGDGDMGEQEVRKD